MNATASSSTSWARASGSTTSPATMLDERHAGALHRRALGHRADLEPDDLRQGDRAPATPTTSRSPSCSRPRARAARSSSSSSRSRTCATPPTSSRAVHERTDGVDGWVSLEVSPLLAYDTEATIAQAARAARQGRARQPASSRSPAPPQGLRGDRGDDLRRDPGQRHAAVLARALPRRGRRLHARDRAADRGRARPGGRLGRLALRQPLGRRGRRRGARPSCATGSGSRSASAPTPPTASCSTPTAGSGSRTRARGRSACCGRAPGPRTPTPPTRSTSRRSPRPNTVNTMPEKTLLAFADHGEVGDAAAAPTAATPSRCWPRSRRPASTSTRSPSACSARAPTPSSSPGTSCCARIAAKQRGDAA